MFRMLVHPSSGASDLLWIYFMCCIALVRCVLVLRCGSAGVVWYPDAGWSKWHQVDLSLFNYYRTVYSFTIYTFLWPEDGPQWPKNVVVSIINRIRYSCVVTPHTPSLIAVQAVVDPCVERFMKKATTKTNQQHKLSTPERKSFPTSCLAPLLLGL